MVYYESDWKLLATEGCCNVGCCNWFLILPWLLLLVLSQNFVCHILTLNTSNVCCVLEWMNNYCLQSTSQALSLRVLTFLCGCDCGCLCGSRSLSFLEKLLQNDWLVSCWIFFFSSLVGTLGETLTDLCAILLFIVVVVVVVVDIFDFFVVEFQ